MFWMGFVLVYQCANLFLFMLFCFCLSFFIALIPSSFVYVYSSYVSILVLLLI
jgi:hypothetical protein